MVLSQPDPAVTCAGSLNAVACLWWETAKLELNVFRPRQEVPPL